MSESSKVTRRPEGPTGTPAPFGLPDGMRADTWDVPDPLGQELALGRAIRDEMRMRVDGLRAALA